ncbi:MAG: hypothetical protein ABSG95_01895 [Solirubrobacteraceae bacterium]
MINEAVGLSRRRAVARRCVAAHDPVHGGNALGQTAAAAKSEGVADGPVSGISRELGDKSPSAAAALGQSEAVTPDSSDDFVQLPDGVEIVQWGLDSVSFAWRPMNPRLWAHLVAPLEDGRPLEGVDTATGLLGASSGVRRTEGGRVLVDEVVGGGRVLYVPAARLIYIEGRLAALAASDPDAQGLASPRLLESVPIMSALEISQLLLPDTLIFEDVSLRRADLACDLSFMDGATGLALLRGLAALDVPRRKSVTYKRDGRVETVNYCTQKLGHIKLRCYDGGVHRGTHRPGELVRVEAQLRFKGAARPDPSEWAQQDLGKLWQGKLAAWEGTEEVVLAGLNAMEREITDAVAAKRLKLPAAETLIGNLRLRASGRGKDYWTAQGHDHLWGRRARTLRDLGLVLDDADLGHEAEATLLPLGRILRAVREAWDTGGDGRGNVGATQHPLTTDNPGTPQGCRTPELAAN